MRSTHPKAATSGLNLGQSAGAGIPDPLHLHVVPSLARRHELHDRSRGEPVGGDAEFFTAEAQRRREDVVPRICVIRAICVLALGACAAEEIYCESGIIGPYFPDFSLNRTTIRLKIKKIWPRFSTFSLRSLLPPRLLAPSLQILDHHVGVGSVAIIVGKGVGCLKAVMFVEVDGGDVPGVYLEGMLLDSLGA